MATPSSYRAQIEDLRRLGRGKSVRAKLYLHVAWLDALARSHPEVVRRARRALAGAADLGVRGDLVSLSDDGVSVLAYPGFLREPEPALAASVRFDRAGRPGAVRSYAEDNPPVLHRKELTAPPGMRRDAWARRTARLERAGAFDRPSTIGRRAAWERTLRRVAVL